MTTLPIGMAIGGIVGLCFVGARAQVVIRTALEHRFRYFKLSVGPERGRTIALVAACVTYSLVGAFASAWLWSAARAAASLFD